MADITLQIKKYGLGITLDEDLFHGLPKEQLDLRLEERSIELARLLAMSMKIPGRTLEKIERSFPVSWWDAFKQAYFPKWLQNWFPVRLEYICVSLDEVYPSLPIPEPAYRILTTSSVTNYSGDF